jgi:Pyridine nucleotide-disulphide oxidoreductase
MRSAVDVVVIGAGPYGLSVAAHLKARGIDFRIFGRPMETWRAHMPKGMRLKSDGFASSLYDPGEEFPLAKHCEQEGFPYADLGLPIPLETFISYGLAFQRRFVRELEPKLVVSLNWSPPGFEVTLDDGETVTARRVVASIGLSHYAYMPRLLARFSDQFVSHSSNHSDVARFEGRRIAVIGGGASAIDLAALLHQAGAAVQVVARKPYINFQTWGPIPRPLTDRIRRPTTGLGPGWRSVWCVHGPLLFRLLPEALRLEVVRKHLGPAPGWFVKDEVMGKVPLSLGMHINGAEVRNDRVSLDLSDQSGGRRTLEADHVIAGTGYRVDLRRLTFIDSRIRAGIEAVEHTPILSSNFESSVPGLYFVGVTAANTFGPLLRFAFGARFAARRISRHLARSIFSVGRTAAEASCGLQYGWQW